MYRKMRIAHVTWSLSTGGIETMLANIINEQVKTENVALFIINDEIEPTILNRISNECRIYKIGRKPSSKSYWKVFLLNMKLKLFCPDIVHVHATRISKTIYCQKNIVRTLHGIYNKTDELPKMKALYAISDYVRDVFVKKGYNNVITVANGISCNDIAFENHSAKDFFEIVQVSRLYVKAKGQHLLLKSLHTLVYERNITNFKMHFIGEGDSLEYLEDLTKELDLEKYVIFEGFKSQDYLFNHLKDYDLFVQPSTNEGFGLTVAEAIAAKLPVLISNIDGPMEIINNGKLGMYFKKGDIVDLADKLETILKGGYDYSMIGSAYDYVKSHYDVSITAKKYIEEYKIILGEKT